MIRNAITIGVLFFTGCSIPKIGRVTNSSNILRLNGYYYTILKYNENFVDFQYLYRNGVFYQDNVSVLARPEALSVLLEEKRINVFTKPKSDSAYFGVWGVYEIHKDTLLIKRYLNAPGHRMYEDRGKILNDSTFFIYETREYPSGKFEKSRPEMTYRFISSDLKPDSSNIFFRQIN